MEKIAVIGGGTMGLDIAQVFARKGYGVLVRDINDEIIKNCRLRLNEKLDRQVKRGRMSEDESRAVAEKILFTTMLSDTADSDLVIEAAVENLEIKKTIFAELDAVCKPEAILATNTSSISISAIASATQRPEKCIGMHFSNPATVMKLVEVIRGAKTSDDTAKAVHDLSVAVGKEPVEANEAPGFVLNKMLIPMINEAVNLLYTGVADAKGIDTAMRLGANHPMGPLELADLIGLDVCLAIMETLLTETGDSKYAPSLLLRKKVRAGELGQKAGKGFFDYS